LILTFGVADLELDGQPERSAQGGPRSGAMRGGCPSLGFQPGNANFNFAKTLEQKKEHRKKDKPGQAQAKNNQ
jgi:hypothetical protein